MKQESNRNFIEELKKIYPSIKKEIESRLNEFKKIWEEGKEEKIFIELIFCILTPQSKAKLCWQAVENLLNKNLLWKGNADEIARELNFVRFKYNKAYYIIEARKQFSINGKVSIRAKISEFLNANEARRWLVLNVKGIGYKEASHFLRNIGFGENFAILDRHILRNLRLLGEINTIPKSLSKTKYLEIEEKMRKLAQQINIPLTHLDLLFWYKETGEIFK
jgi:N-glycosylase/DNA lyase